MSGIVYDDSVTLYNAVRLMFLLQTHTEQGNPHWKPVFVALTDKDLLLYDVAPSSKEEWAAPFQSHSILATR